MLPGWRATPSQIRELITKRPRVRGPLFLLCFSRGMRAFPLLYIPFFLFLAFFFMTLFLAVSPLTQSKQWQQADERGVNRSWQRRHRAQTQALLLGQCREQPHSRAGGEFRQPNATPTPQRSSRARKSIPLGKMRVCFTHHGQGSQAWAPNSVCCIYGKYRVGEFQVAGIRSKSQTNTRANGNHSNVICRK